MTCERELDAFNSEFEEVQDEGSRSHRNRVWLHRVRALRTLKQGAVFMQHWG